MAASARRGRPVLEAVLRRPRLVLGPLVVASLLGLAFSWAAPRRYRASAHVRAEWLSDPAVESASVAAGLAERRFEALRQRVLARSPTESVSVKRGAGDELIIECVDGDPARAARVPNLVARLLVEEAERERLEDGEEDRKAVESRLAAARRKVEDAEGAIVRFRASHQDDSEAVQALERLALEYEVARKAYRALQEEWERAEIASRIGAGRQVRFTVLRSATAPSSTVSPSGVLIVLLGAALGLVGGLGAAVIADLRDRSVKGPEDLHQALPFPILAEIPLVRGRRFGRRAPK